MAAVLRASGIVASFVYDSWLRNSMTPPSPDDIFKAITEAAFTPGKRSGLNVLHIPPEVSRRPKAPSPQSSRHGFGTIADLTS
ncbi:hypothetical protein H0H93_006203 [Arthromyces matolae]|nr:hypothetical protein H0H93_006203 [Arthromyces matolae]